MKNEDMKEDLYETPKWIKELFYGWYDPIPISEGQLRIKDGLSEWKDRSFINPPYSNPLPFVLKAIEENKKGKTIALLLKLDCSTKWFLKLSDAKAHLLLINERVKFNGYTPPFPSMIAILPGDLKNKTDQLIKEGKQKILSK